MLRHACGYKLANEGHDTRAIQHYLGHRNIQNTVRYTQLCAQRFKDFLEGLKQNEGSPRWQSVNGSVRPSREIRETLNRPSNNQRAALYRVLRALIGMTHAGDFGDSHFLSGVGGGIGISRVGQAITGDVDNDRFIVRLGEVSDPARLAVEASAVATLFSRCPWQSGCSRNIRCRKSPLSFGRSDCHAVEFAYGPVRVNGMV
jgi:hypothetical protein